MLFNQQNMQTVRDVCTINHSMFWLTSCAPTTWIFSTSSRTNWCQLNWGAMPRKAGNIWSASIRLSTKYSIHHLCCNKIAYVPIEFSCPTNDECCILSQILSQYKCIINTWFLFAINFVFRHIHASTTLFTMASRSTTSNRRLASRLVHLWYWQSCDLPRVVNNKR